MKWPIAHAWSSECESTGVLEPVAGWSARVFVPSCYKCETVSCVSRGTLLLR